MKSFLKKHVKQAELKYPCLKEYEDKDGHSVVLFTWQRCGVYVYTTALQNYVGEVGANFNETLFTPFLGEVIIKN